MTQVQEVPPVSEREVDDPAGSLRSFIRAVGEVGNGEGFAEVKPSLLEAIELPKTVVHTV